MKKLIIKEINLISGGMHPLHLQAQTHLQAWSDREGINYVALYSSNYLNSKGTQTYSPPKHGMSRKNMLLLGINIAVFAISLAFIPKSKTIAAAEEEEQSYCEKKCVQKYS